jgi:two-component system cell cycle response regulator
MIGKRKVIPGQVVLIVEDSPTQAISIKSLLIDAGLRVICATNGQTGLRLAQQVKPALVLLDIQMPDINGFEVCGRLKQNDETKDIPVIMLTRNTTPEAVQQGLEQGAIDYIPKDAFTSAVLLETLRQMSLIEPNWQPALDDNEIYR